MLSFGIPALLLLAGLAGASAPGTWPVADPVVRQRFVAPSSNYGPGHRGVDVTAQPGDPLLAPLAGVIGFAGSVAGKPVVAIDHANGLRTTYEPATTGLPVGSPVTRGQVFAAVAAGTGHCGLVPTCVHWGAKQAGAYLDPVGLVAHDPPVLLPLGPADQASATDPQEAPAGPLRRPAPVDLAAEGGVGLVGGVGLLVLSRRGPRRVSRATAARPSCASGRSGSR